MKSTIKAIIFDFGNVLLEWNPGYVYRRYFPNDPEAMDHFFREVDFMKWNAQQDKGRSFAEGVADLTRQFPHYSHLIQVYHDHWEDSIGGPNIGTVNILKRLKKLGYALYGFSNWSAETFPYARAKFEFFELFDDMVISGEVGFVKPEPAIYHLMLQRVGRPAHECLFIDDSLPNIEQANKMGFVTIHFESAGQLEAELNHSGIL